MKRREVIDGHMREAVNEAISKTNRIEDERTSILMMLVLSPSIYY
jgi:hypothetical protein